MNDLKGIIEDCNKSDLVSDKVIKKVIEIIGQEEWQILHDENNDVCTTMGELIITLNGIAELEAQIEKMKCCENCGWFYLQQHWRESKEINESRMFHCGTCGNKKNWKLKEIKEK